MARLHACQHSTAQHSSLTARATGSPFSRFASRCRIALLPCTPALLLPLPPAPPAAPAVAASPVDKVYEVYDKQDPATEAPADIDAVAVAVAVAAAAAGPKLTSATTRRRKAKHGSSHRLAMSVCTAEGRLWGRPGGCTKDSTLGGVSAGAT